MHLPVVAALQVGSATGAALGLKYPFVVLTSLALLLLSYHWLVRSTPIGKLLNGRPCRAAARQLRRCGCG